MSLYDLADIESRNAINRRAWAGLAKDKATPKVAKVKVPVPTEHQEQAAVIAWCDQHRETKHIFAIPNGCHKSMPSAAKFRREGLRKGIPDLMVPVARSGFHGLFIEMKRTKGSVTSAEQLAWFSVLRREGYAAYACKGAADAIAVIELYLS